MEEGITPRKGKEKKTWETCPALSVPVIDIKIEILMYGLLRMEFASPAPCFSKKRGVH
jgi:hypothetical protein